MKNWNVDVILIVKKAGEPAVTTSLKEEVTKSVALAIQEKFLDYGKKLNSRGVKESDELGSSIDLSVSVKGPNQGPVILAVKYPDTTAEMVEAVQSGLVKAGVVLK